MTISKHEIDKETTNFYIKVHRIVHRLYEEAQDEPDCLYWQAAQMLEKFIDHAICYQCKAGNETFTTLDKQVAKEWSEDFEVTSNLIRITKTK